MKPTEVPYKDESKKEFHHSINSLFLTFSVVNNPQTEIDFEDLPAFDFGDVNMAELNRDSARITSLVEQISMPNFRILYQNLINGDHSLPMNNEGINLHYLDTSSPAFDITKCSPGAKAMVDAGVKLAYISRINLTLSGTSPTTYNYADGRSVSVDVPATEGDIMLYDNIPVTAVIVKTGEEHDDVPSLFYTTTDVESVLYMPIDWINRFDVDANQAKNQLYKFDYHIIAANETIQTNVFDDSTCMQRIGYH
jgi:hypothetical protein